MCSSGLVKVDRTYGRGATEVMVMRGERDAVLMQVGTTFCCDDDDDDDDDDDGDLER